MAKLAAAAPAYCSVCFGQYPDRRHVDFDAAWDGPVIDSGNGMKQAIDDLIMCENCVRRGAEILALDDVAAPEMAALVEQVETLKALNEGQRKYIAQLEATVQAKQAVPRRPKVDPRKPRATAKA